MYHLKLTEESEKFDVSASDIRPAPDDVIMQLSASDPKTMANCLRMVADQLDPPIRAQHFVHPNTPGIRGGA